jgi:[ribosomal protein S5]-alanine N-acetyltransferase
MLVINFNPFPILESGRLLLRQLSINDADEVFSLRSNPHTMKYIPRPLAKTKSDAIEHIELIQSKIKDNTAINWAISLKGEQKMIGIIGLYRIYPENHRAEIGYMSLPEKWGKGYTTEAIRSVLDYGFCEMGLNSIEAIIDPNNLPSGRVLVKNGFIKEGHLRQNVFFDEHYLDSVIYSILKQNARKE